jgi:Mn-containing catalase
MFRHTQQTQYNCLPDKPDPLYAMKLQEILGGAWGEMTVAMQYLFQGWNTRIPGKYKDLILDTATEELGHVEMICIMIARLLEGAPAEQTSAAAAANPALAAVLGGQNPQHAIVGGGGALPADSNGYPWNGKYIVASGNLLADFHANATAEMQGRLQVARIYNMTDDHGVRDMLRFNLARDTCHQNQWLAAIEQLKEEGLEEVPVPIKFGLDEEYTEHSYEVWGLSDGVASAEGRWASGPSIDGRGEFTYLDQPDPLGPVPETAAADPLLYATVDGGSRTAAGGTAPASGGGGLLDKAKEAVTGAVPGTHTDASPEKG